VLDCRGTTLAPTSGMVHCPSLVMLVVGVAGLSACTREPARTAVDPTSGAPAQPLNGSPSSVASPAPGATQANPPQATPSPPSATTTPATPDANPNSGGGTKVPSSTQARDTPPPAQVPNAMPQPEPL